MPSQRTLAGGAGRVCAEVYNQAAQLVNAKLSPALDSLAKTLPQSRVVYIDIYNPLLNLIQYPQNYGELVRYTTRMYTYTSICVCNDRVFNGFAGFEVSDRGCCGTGDIEVIVLCNRYSGTCADDSKYVFWDSYHPTEKAYKVIVEQIIEKYVDKFL